MEKTFQKSCSAERLKEEEELIESKQGVIALFAPEIAAVIEDQKDPLDWFKRMTVC